MQTDELYGFIDSSYTQELALVMKETIEFLVSVDLSDSMADLMELVMSSSYMDTQDLRDSFYSKLQALLIEVLQEHTIIVDSQAKLSELLSIAQALVNIPSYIDPTQIEITLDAPISAEEKLITLLKLVGSVDEDMVTTILDSVSYTLFDRIREMTFSPQETKVFDEKVIDSVKSYLEYLNKTKESIDAIALIERDLQFGLPFKAYVDIVDDYLKDKTPYAQAKEIMFFLKLSSDGYKEGLLTYRKYSDLLFTSIDLISRVDVQLTRITADMDLFEAKQKWKNQNSLSKPLKQSA